MKLTLAACRTLGEIDLGEADRNYFEDGDLGDTGGNLYLYLDGKEWGSLFFFKQDDGSIKITLGQYDDEAQEWVERNPLTKPVEEPENE